MWKRLIDLFLGCAIMAIVATAPMGCAKCGDVLPQIVEAQSVVDDGQRALMQAQAVLQAVDMPEGVRRDLSDAIERGWKAMAKISRALRAGAQLCESQSLDNAIKEFNAAWSAIKSVLQLFGETGDGGVRYVGTGVGVAPQYAGSSAVVAFPIDDPPSFE